MRNNQGKTYYEEQKAMPKGDAVFIAGVIVLAVLVLAAEVLIWNL